ncbi:hypothetical protein Cni_G07628 [Canna indica]|uniref:Late embryogenesis abundant protein LEA-2 subgroup domain-containing protein n=1 Tax=Canna indica TaxID=4628 RepID=A0AAQ3JZD7_9LILI|nr:hypothetical protein Cni_G07628 [Canna indica]
MAQPARASRPSIIRCVAVTGLALIVLLGLAVLIFWLAVRPKPLEYTVDDTRVHGFNITDHALNATFDLTLRSYNRNHHVSVYYDDVEATVWYDEQLLAGAEVAPFYQPRRNVTTLDVRVAARAAPLLSSVEKSLKRERSGGGVAFEVRVWARIRLKVGAVKTRHYTLKAYCSPVLVRFPSAQEFEKVYCDVDI